MTIVSVQDREQFAGQTARWLSDLTTPSSDVRHFFESMSDHQLKSFMSDWGEWGRNAQQIPKQEFFIWLMMTGRGWGKSRTESEFVHTKAFNCPGSHGALVARTVPDVRDTVVQGISGIMATAKPWNPVEYIPSLRLLKWANGSTAHTYSSEKPAQLRGPNFHWALGDEWATWKRSEDDMGGTAWDNLKLATRLAWRNPKTFEVVHPQICLGTTPRPTQQMRNLLKEHGLIQTRGGMFENSLNLSQVFIDMMVKAYQGTRLGRQELNGELLEQIEDAFVQMEHIDDNRVDTAPMVERTVVAIDPPISSGDSSDLAGIIAAGRDGQAEPHGYLLEDWSCRASPAKWARKAIRLYHEVKADTIVAEINQGGEMVEHTIHSVDKSIPVKTVFAKKGKHLRAEPVTVHYERGRIHHVGDPNKFTVVEDQLIQFTPQGYEGEGSPDNADALVYAFTELLIGKSSIDIGSISIPTVGRSSSWKV